MDNKTEMIVKIGGLLDKCDVQMSDKKMGEEILKRYKRILKAMITKNESSTKK